MKTIHVCGRSNVAAYQSTYPITHLLTLLDPGRKRPFLHPLKPTPQWLFLNFYDSDDDKLTGSPILTDVERILEWGSKLPDDAHVLSHCEAGISRSTSAALLLMIQDDPNYKNGTFTQEHLDVLIKKLVKIRPCAVPNRLISRYGDQLLGLNGILANTVDALVESYMLDIYKIAPKAIK